MPLDEKKSVGYDVQRRAVDAESMPDFAAIRLCQKLPICYPGFRFLHHHMSWSAAIFNVIRSSREQSCCPRQRFGRMIALTLAGAFAKPKLGP